MLEVTLETHNALGILLGYLFKQNMSKRNDYVLYILSVC